MSNGFTVVGIKHATGEYQGVKFDNFNLQCLRDAASDSGEEGQICEIIKIKSSLLDEVPQIGQVVEPIYDRYGRVVRVDVL